MNDIMARAGAMGLPKRREVALDFGCGVGRVTRAMRSCFPRCIGIDVSDAIIATARRLNDGKDGLEFIHNDRPDLALIDDESIDLVYSSIVLQHLPNLALIDAYLGEFVRVLRVDGLLVFQPPGAIPLRRRLQPRPRAYALLRRMGVPASTLRGRLGLHPVRMRGACTEHATAVLEGAGAGVVDAVGRTDAEGISNRTYWVTKPPVA